MELIEYVEYVCIFIIFEFIDIFILLELKYLKKGVYNKLVR